MNELLRKLIKREVGYYDIRHLRLDGAELEEFEKEARADERRKIRGLFAKSKQPLQEVYDKQLKEAEQRGILKGTDAERTRWENAKEIGVNKKSGKFKAIAAARSENNKRGESHRN